VETVIIGQDRIRAVRRDDILMVGASKTDSISTSYLIEVGENLRLVCGKSVLELNASGQINLTGLRFNFNAEENAQFNTPKGTLDLNIGGEPGTTCKAQGDKDKIDAAVDAIFPKNS